MKFYSAIIFILSVCSIQIGCSDDDVNPATSAKSQNIDYEFSTDKTSIVNADFDNISFVLEKIINFEAPVRSVRLFDRKKVGNSLNVTCVLTSDSPALSLPVGEKLIGSDYNTGQMLVSRKDSYNGYQFGVRDKDNTSYQIDCLNLDASTTLAQLQEAFVGIFHLKPEK